MPDPRLIEETSREAAAWRRHLHANPEVGFAVEGTAAFVAGKLRGFGVDEVVEGVGRTGVVGIIHGRGPGRTLGLRADMDALPIEERTNLPHASRRPGKMHACGHDGHTAMLLAAARCLAQDRDFSGRVVLVFQPAEEGEGGARAMLDDGLLDRFGVEEVYGIHNMPGMPVGAFGARAGAIMGAVDRFSILLTGKGSHAAMPHQGADPVLAGAHIVKALQALVSRRTDPLEAAVVTVTEFHAGEAFNIIPDSARLGGTVRAISPGAQARIVEELHRIVREGAKAFGATAEITYEHLCPPTVNHPAQAEAATVVARAVLGATQVDGEVAPIMPGEDFAHMLEERPGAFVFLGNGPSAPLHHPAYDFDDGGIVHGVRFWTALVATRCGTP